ncbi:LOW QUALITY PROTEIN: sterile alpha motif domain-containing protein 9-like [Pelodytes ibericus]
MAELLHSFKKVDLWTKDQVQLWVTNHLKISTNEGEILHKQNVTGEVLQLLTKKDFIEMGITYGSAVLITQRLKELNTTSCDVQQNNEGLDTKHRQTRKPGAKKTQKATMKEHVKDLQDQSLETNENNEVENYLKASQTCDLKPSKVTCTPYPFDKFHEIKRYREYHFLQPESGTSNYIDPVHEYKAFNNTTNAMEEDKKMKFCNELFRFAAACMNARTNGTIHFGVQDKPHGQIIGVLVDGTDTYVKYYDQMMSKYFEEKQVPLAKQCIRPPRFVAVLSEQNILSDNVVIEVDVVPAHAHCKDEIFCTYQQVSTENTWKKSKEKSCFIRDGESSKDILSNVRSSDADFKSFFSQMKSRDDSRKTAEENYRRKQVKTQNDGPKLVRLLTGNRGTLDNSYYKWYILIANKSHPSQTKHLDFMNEINCIAVLDFDSESLISGACKFYRDKRVANLHQPCQYQNITREQTETLKLFQQTSWIFCNGRSDLDSKEYEPLSFKLWQKERAAEVRRLISFLSQKDILERGKFLVVFLLFTEVDDCVDPMIETFNTFYQELGGMQDMLCLCEGEQTFHKWRDLQLRLVTAEELNERCVYSLDIEQINGTILKLRSVIQSSNRFLPSHGSSSIVLLKKDEDLMSCLNILCSNECEDTELESNTGEFQQFKTTKEEEFYRGGKATWWNFYFSAKSYTSQFIKRDTHDQLIELIQSCDQQTNVKLITLYHHPGCGGSTSAMHALWELRNKFRCATLKRNTDSFTDIAREVTNLAIHGSTAKNYFPVLLLVDDYEEDENIIILQNCIRTAIVEKFIRYEKPVVIILNCMRSQNPQKSAKLYCAYSVALQHKLSPQEQRAFETKLEDIEQQHEKPEDFYSFMIMKSNFDKKYISKVVRNLLKGLNSASKEANLISFLALLNKYVKNSTISASLCEEFLGITAQHRFWGPETIEDKMGKYFTYLCTEVEEYGRFKGLRIIHPLIASHCIEELKETYDMHQSKIMLQLLRTCVHGIGKEMHLQNMQSMLVTRHKREHGDETDTLFSPLIEEIQKEEGNERVETVLKEGSVRFNQYPYIFQALARHYYIREKNFKCAKEWAEKAKKIAPNNSFVLDTFGQIFKTQLKSMMDECNKKQLTPGDLKNLLDTAVAASEAFRECQEQTQKTESEREETEKQSLKEKKRHNVYNTAGYLGQIEVCLYTIDILLRLSWFSSGNDLSRKHLIQYLSGKWDISVDKDSRMFEDFHNVLTEFRYFLTKVKSHLQMAFDFFNIYFVHLKQKNIHKESAYFKIREKVTEYFKKYRRTFCDLDLMQTIRKKELQKCSLSLCLEDYRIALEGCKADRFPGILEYLTDHGKNGDKMKGIVQVYEYLLQNRTDKFILRDKENFILANIVLHCICPNSKAISPTESLKRYLREVLERVGSEYEHLEPYFLASLLFWPHDMHHLDSDSQHLEKYINSMRKCFRARYRHMCHAKQPIAHFYLGQNKGLKRLIHKGRIDQCFPHIQDLHSLWQCGDIWKEQETAKLLLRVNGRAEHNTIYVECGNTERIKIPVRPAYLGQLRSGRSIERVSFFLGFSIDGLIAYNIESITN